MKTIMPDLFIVMSDEELEEAIDYANQQGVKQAEIYQGIQYKLSFKNEDIYNYISENDCWFPAFTDYIVMPGLNDTIGILLSPTVWNNYNLDKVYKSFKKYNIDLKTKQNNFIDQNDYNIYKENEKIYSTNYPINSPWTARDIEVVENALDTIEGIDSALLYLNTNVKIECMYLAYAGTPIPFPVNVAEFDYPNILKLNTITGNYNIFMGNNIKAKEIISMVSNKGISIECQDFNWEDLNEILYQHIKISEFNQFKQKKHRSAFLLFF